VPLADAVEAGAPAEAGGVEDGAGLADPEQPAATRASRTTSTPARRLPPTPRARCCSTPHLYHGRGVLPCACGCPLPARQEAMAHPAHRPIRNPDGAEGTTTMPHHVGPDHDDVASSWLGGLDRRCCC